MHSAPHLALNSAATLAVAAERTGIQIDRPWAQLVAPGRNTVAVYVTVVSKPGDILVGISSPSANDAAIYRTLMKGGHASLFPIDGGLTLAPDQPLLMAPHGTEIRLSGLKQDIEAGQTLTLTLSFARAGKISVTVPIESPAAAGPPP